MHLRISLKNRDISLIFEIKSHLKNILTHPLIVAARFQIFGNEISEKIHVITTNNSVINFKKGRIK